MIYMVIAGPTRESSLADALRVAHGLQIFLAEVAIGRSDFLAHAIAAYLARP